MELTEKIAGANMGKYLDLVKEVRDLEEEHRRVSASLEKKRNEIEEMWRSWDFENCSGGGKCCKYFGRYHFCDAPGDHPRTRFHVAVSFLEKDILKCPLREEM